MTFILILTVFLNPLLLMGLFYLWNRLKKEKLKNEKKDRETIVVERNQLRILIDRIPDVIFIKDRESRFVLANERVASVMGTTREELIGKTDFDYYTPDLAQRYYDDEQAIMESGEPKINYEEPHLDELGNRIILSTSKVPIRDEDGKVVGIVGIGRDITRLKRIEIQLRRKTEDLQEANRLLEERQEETLIQAEELAAQTQNLRISNIELERLNKTKDKFFSIIAHDLKNPFNAIMGFSNMLVRDYIDLQDPQKIDLIEMISLSSEAAYNLLENLLQWAGSQTDKISFSPEHFAFCQVVDQVLQLQLPVAEKKGIRLVNHISPVTQIFADRNMVHTIMRNLVSNAIKFSGPGSKVQISERDTGDQVEFMVIDQGVGMSQETLRKLFRIDTYHSTSGTAGETGTGLGLVLCKEFVEKNQGRIRATSKVGVGTTVCFTLLKNYPGKN